MQPLPHPNHGGEASDLKLENSRNTPYDKDMNFFNIFINKGRICMGFEAVEKGQKLAYLIRFSEKCLIKKLFTSKG